ncbi:hypothetical protein H2200_007823 [Cladophialophora chaetospira]|uniref:Uncharacterized protein n=1 Tax=Cladophialophora chaetospira TaxID=386627 RepID=A0AA38X6H6_9EURO|nr:hypothetical protein H2200_007823 [Cladophialophora chaetospira]
MTDESFTFTASDAVCSINPSLSKLREKNRTWGARLQQSSEEHEVSAVNADENIERARVERHCEDKIGFCRSRIEELNLSIETLDSENLATPPERLEIVEQLEQVELELYVLKTQRPRLTERLLLCQYNTLAQAYARCLTDVAKGMVPFRADTEEIRKEKANSDQSMLTRTLVAWYFRVRRFRRVKLGV